MKHSSRNIGMHLRLTESYSALAQQAQDMGMPIFQTFLVPQKGKRYLDVTDHDQESFLKLRSYFKDIYLHTSYWINLASMDEHIIDVSKRLITKEIALAKKLHINNLVLHPGAAAKQSSLSTDAVHKKRGIKILAAVLNEIVAQEPEITIILENNMHAGATIGSDLYDFAQLKQLFTCNNTIKYCIDTAHAFSYGYDITKLEAFVELIDATMGIENLKVIHLNDSAELFGSKKDAHAPPGQGYIGKALLQNFINHPRLVHLPIIIEMPAHNVHQLEEVYKDVQTWL